MKLSINVPSTVSLSVIQAALAALGVSIVQRKPKAEKEFPPLFYKKRIHVGHSDAQHYLDANPEAMQDDTSVYIPMEMDGVSVLKAMRKIENALKSAMYADCRTVKDFPSEGLAKRMTTAEYVADIEGRWSLTRTAELPENAERMAA